jgi:hypothetical protein
MPSRRVAFITMSGAVVGFVMAIYGAFRAFDPVVGIVVAALAVAALVVGMALLLVTLRRESFGPPHVAVVAVTIAALALHVYESRYSSAGLSIGFLLWATLPYVLSVGMSSVSAIGRAATAGAVVALLFDISMYYSVSVNPKGSTAALGLLFMPLWNTLVFVPAATALAHVILRRRSKTTLSAS